MGRDDEHSAVCVSADGVVSDSGVIAQAVATHGDTDDLVVPARRDPRCLLRRTTPRPDLR